MRYLLITLFLAFPLFANIDNRNDIANSKDQKYQQWGKSVAAMIKIDHISKGHFRTVINGESLQETGIITNLIDWGTGTPCHDMKFINEPAIAHCSAFLVAPDIIMTAGHCVSNFNRTDVKEGLCEDYKWVFDYKLSKSQLRKLKSGRITTVDKIKVPNKNIVGCKEVISFKDEFMTPIYAPGVDPTERIKDEDGLSRYPRPIDYNMDTLNDYALIRLDRKITNRTPFDLRSGKQVKLGERIAVIGHPQGLPSKISTGVVRLNNERNIFSSDLLSFTGNSGSPAINLEDGVVEGILTGGGEPFVRDEQRSCYSINSEITNSMNKLILTRINRISAIEDLEMLLQKEQ